MSTSPNLGLPFILAAQAQKHVTHNEAIRGLDAVVQLMVLDRNLAAAPASPADGARYIVAAAATGVWAGQTNNIAAYQDGAWAFYLPKEGWIAWIADEDIAAAWTGTVWSKISTGGAGSYTTLGINATADATNKLALASAASLFNHAGAGHQQKINKNAAADTASQLFQSGFSGRAEWGLNGSDDMSLKVSPDGTTFSEVFSVARATAQATFAKGVEQIQVDTFTASGTWTKPAWARHVEIILVGGGSGGGSGRRGAAATDRFGGGGGSGGTVAIDRFPASELSATMSVDIGAGGTGGAGATVNDTNGNAGTSGGTTVFRDGATTFVQALGGQQGSGGTATAGTAGVGIGGTSGVSHPGGAGSNSTGANAGANANMAGPGSGAGGGGLNTANTAAAGGIGSAGYRAGGTSRQAAGGSAGAIGGAGGNGAVKAWSRGTGGGAGAGGANGGNGGDGAAPGGAGAGGGASLNGTNSGAGGAGARGEAWIISRG